MTSHPNADGFGLRYFLAKGPEGRKSYVRDALASDGRVTAVWTDDEAEALRFVRRKTAEFVRDAIMAADVERRSAIALIPEA